MNDSKIVLVTGATGKQGGAVARHLLDAGLRVRILARNPAKASAVALQARGAEVLEGDMENVSSLRTALTDIYGVFSVQNFWEKGVGRAGEIRQAKNLTDAASEAGVKHFVQASVADARAALEVEHFACKWEVEQYIDQIGLPRTFLGEVFYMDNFVDPKAGAMMLPVLSGTLSRSTQLHMIAVEDIGAVATVVFKDPERYVGKKIDIAGDRLSVEEMRQVYERVTGKRAKRWSMPSFVLRLMLPDMYRQLRWNNSPGWQFDVGATRQIIPEPTSFAEFIARHQISNL